MEGRVKGEIRTDQVKVYFCVRGKQKQSSVPVSVHVT